MCVSKYAQDSHAGLLSFTEEAASVNRLRSLRCVVNGEWVGSPRRLAYAHVVSDKSEIGEGGKETPRGFSLQSGGHRRGESDTGKPPDSHRLVDLTLKTNPSRFCRSGIRRSSDSGPAVNHTVKPDQTSPPHLKGILQVDLRGNTQWQPVRSFLPVRCLLVLPWLREW